MLHSELEPAFLLHSRPYRNTSMLVNFFTLNYGRIDAVVRGARSPKSKNKGLLQLFTPVLINWYGSGELVTIKNIEPNGFINLLQGDGVFYGIYINELLIKLLHTHDPHLDVFNSYTNLLQQFSHQTPTEKDLRCFEKQLLIALGYGLHLDSDSETGEALQEDYYYHYIPDKGPVKVDSSTQNNIFCGKNLMAINQNQFDNPDILRDAKRLMRYALQQLLGDKTLKSRELFV
jgi:DNA repair protein RecO (recombination protein O)